MEMLQGDVWDQGTFKQNINFCRCFVENVVFSTTLLDYFPEISRSFAQITVRFVSFNVSHNGCIEVEILFNTNLDFRRLRY